jgi:hypothetical protein
MNGPQDRGRTGVGVVDLLDKFEDVSGFLDQLVHWAVTESPGAEACGLTLEQAGRGLTVTYSGELAARGDERQYELDDGPCLEAMRSGEVVTVADMATEQRWGSTHAVPSLRGCARRCPSRSRSGSGAAGR